MLTELSVIALVVAIIIVIFTTPVGNDIVRITSPDVPNDGTIPL